MRKKVKKEYLKVLELGENASRDDIENAYSYFVRLYSSEDSPEITALKDDLSITERNRILSDIDKAYKALVGDDGVNRFEFSSKIEQQEIVLEDESVNETENNEAEDTEEIPDENEPVIEFIDTVDPIHDIPVEGSSNVDAKTETSDNGAGDEIDSILEFPLEESPDVDNEKDEIKFEISKSADPVVEFPGEVYSDDGDHLESEIEKIEIHDNINEESVVEITGKYLKKQRESRGIKPRELGSQLNISHKIITYIENEKFEKLEDPGYLRWAIKAYAKFLGISTEKCAEDYMRRYRNKK